MQDIDGYRRFTGGSIYDSPSHLQWPVSSSRLSPPRARAETAVGYSSLSFASGTRRALNRGRPEEDVRCHYADLPTNFTGRPFDDVFADMAALVSPKSPKEPKTPSLVSDDPPWPSPSTSSLASPISYTHSLSRDVSPPTSLGQPMPKGRKRSFAEVEEDSLVSATEALKIWSTSRRLSLDIQVGSDIEEPPLIQVEAPPAEETRDTSPGLSDPLPSEQSAQMLGPRSTIQQLLEAAELQRLDTPYIETRKEPLEEKEHAAEEMSSPVPNMRSITPHSSASPSERHPGMQPKQPKAKVIECTQCAKTFTRQYDLGRHIKSKHEVQTTAVARARTCPVCYETLSRPDAFRRHCKIVPKSCVRVAKLYGKPIPPPQPESLYKLCWEGKPPLPEMRPPGRPSA